MGDLGRKFAVAQRAFEPFVGQWALTQKPDHVGWSDPDPTKPAHVNIRNEVDLGLSLSGES